MDDNIENIMKVINSWSLLQIVTRIWDCNSIYDALYTTRTSFIVKLKTTAYILNKFPTKSVLKTSFKL